MRTRVIAIACGLMLVPLTGWLWLDPLLAETAAAYRCLRNEQVSCEEVMTAHRQATMGRIHAGSFRHGMPAGHGAPGVLGATSMPLSASLAFISALCWIGVWPNGAGQRAP